MEWFVLYLFVMIEKLSGLLNNGYAIAAWSLLAFAGVVVICFFYWLESGDEFTEVFNTALAKRARKIALWFIAIGLTLGVIGSLLPTHKQLAVIVGSGLTYQAVTSDQGKRIGGKAVDLLEKQIDDALKDDKAVIIPQAVTDKAKEIVKESAK